MALRVGGVFLVLIALLVAVTCGFLVVDRVTRPVRLLLRLVESGELESGGGVFLHHREWEIFHLYRRVHALVLQNRSAADALGKLRQLEETVHDLLEDLRRPVTHGVLPSLGEPAAEADGSLRELVDQLASHRARLLEYLADLTTQTTEIRKRVTELETALEAHLSTVGDSKGRIATALTAATAPLPPAVAESPSAREQDEREQDDADEPATQGEVNGDPVGTSLEGSEQSVRRVAHALAAGDNGWYPIDALDESDPCTEPIETAFGSLEHVRRLGVVAALEAERLAGIENRRVGEVFDRFQDGVSKLELALDAWVTATVMNGSDDEASRPGHDADDRTRESADHADIDVATASPDHQTQEWESRQRELQAAAEAALDALDGDPCRRLSEASRLIDESLSRLERRLAEVEIS